MRRAASNTSSWRCLQPAKHAKDFTGHFEAANDKEAATSPDDLDNRTAHLHYACS